MNVVQGGGGAMGGAALDIVVGVRSARLQAIYHAISNRDGGRQRHITIPAHTVKHRGRVMQGRGAAVAYCASFTLS